MASAINYDEQGRIKKVTYSNGSQITYSYDENGNRTSVTSLADEWSVDLGVVYYGDGSDVVSLAPGEEGQVLTTHGAAAPTWEDPAIGGLVWRGPWNSSTNYVVDEAVSYGGSTYIAIADNVNSQPPSGDWNLLAAKGDTGDAGAEGPQGPEGPAGDDGLTWRGAWSSATSYVTDDAVSYSGSSYVAIANNSNSQPPSANWNLLAAKGATGDTGPQGPEGPEGPEGPAGSAGVSDPSICQLRVALTASDPWGLTAVTNGGTLYVIPVFGKRIGIWDGSKTTSMKVGSFSVSLSGKTAQNYRLYVYDNNADGVVDSAELVAWTNSTTPPSDTLVDDGYYVKTGSTSRRAVADIMLHGTAQCDWRDARRGICHLDERMRREARLTAYPADDSWAVARTSTTWRRIASGATIGQHYVEFILSNSTFVDAEAQIIAARDAGGSGNLQYQFGLGLDTTSANSATRSMGFDAGIWSGSNTGGCFAEYKTFVSAGKRTLNIVEQNVSSRDGLAYGDNGGSIFQSGMTAKIAL